MSVRNTLTKVGLLAAAVVSVPPFAGADGLSWPDHQLLPAFSTPAPVIDCIDVSSSSNPEINLFASMQGIVNRTQPRIACVSSGDGEGKFTWISLHNLSTNVISGYSAILKYRTNFSGLVVTDPNLPDTLNLATTIAGVKNELICDPSLLATLTNAPYSLAVVDDLRGRFADKYAVYGYLYTNYWPLCSHRVIAGMETNLAGYLRDYLVAVKSATVWLHPGTIKDANLLGLFLSQMTPTDAVYGGWWPSEGNGLTWIAKYGVPVLASDYFRNGSLYGGVTRRINVPDVPPPPPLQNKIYVSLILSDGDNIQYDQHAMKLLWENSSRGSIPIGWTMSPHLFLLYNQVYGYPVAATQPAVVTAPGAARLRGTVIPKAANASAWMEWGTNSTYSFKTAPTNVAGNALAPVSASLSGLSSGTVYHYRAAAISRKYGSLAAL